MSAPAFIGEKKLGLCEPRDGNDRRGEYALYTRRYLFSFGAYGWTHVLTYADHLEDAVEQVWPWLEEHLPGELVNEHVKEEYKRLLNEARKAGEDIEDDEVIERCQQEAEVDTTCVGSSGIQYVNSWEWSVIEDATRAEVIRARDGE